MTSSTLVAAKDLYAYNGLTPLNGNESDPHQPVAKFMFGEEPAATRNADIKSDGSRVKALVIGAGNVDEMFTRHAQLHRGTFRYIYDPYMPKSLEDSLQPNELRIIDKNNLPEDIDYILITTTPGRHLIDLEWALAQGKPVVMEKPLAETLGDLEKIEKLFVEAEVPIYCIDWQIEHAKPALFALFQSQGICVPYEDVLSVDDPRGSFSDFNPQEITEIYASFVEGIENPCTDPETIAASRPEVFKAGMLLDLAVHPLNTLAVQGFELNHIKSCMLGAVTDEFGKYKRFGKSTQNPDMPGEIYAEAELHMTYPGSDHDIKTILKVGKLGSANDGRLIYKDIHGKTLDWEMFPKDGQGNRLPGSRVTLKDASGATLASASMKTDCYALVYANATLHSLSGKSGVLYGLEQIRMLRTTLAIREAGLSYTPEPDEQPEIINQVMPPQTSISSYSEQPTNNL